MSLWQAQQTPAAQQTTPIFRVGDRVRYVGDPVEYIVYGVNTRDEARLKSAATGARYLGWYRFADLQLVSSAHPPVQYVTSHNGALVPHPARGSVDAGVAYGYIPPTPAPTAKCECGAAATGTLPRAIGHSSYCPVRA